MPIQHKAKAVRAHGIQRAAVACAAIWRGAVALSLATRMAAAKPETQVSSQTTQSLDAWKPRERWSSRREVCECLPVQIVRKRVDSRDLQIASLGELVPPAG
jgi:cell division protein FtsN